MPATVTPIIGKFRVWSRPYSTLREAEDAAKKIIKAGNKVRIYYVPPRVAMLSYSTGDSGSGTDVEKVREAVGKLPETDREDALRQWADAYVAKERQSSGAGGAATTTGAAGASTATCADGGTARTTCRGAMCAGAVGCGARASRAAR